MSFYIDLGNAPGIDPAPHMEAVALSLLGEPNRQLSSRKERRFGSRGSLSVDLEAGTFFDFETNAGGGVIDLICRETGQTPAGAFEWLEANIIGKPAPRYASMPATGPKPRIVETYRYEDETGAHLFDVLRFEPKDFRQRAADGSWTVKGVRKVLYRLPQIAAAPDGGEVFIVEGEKDVHALEALGLLATTCPAGAGKWCDDYSATLRGKTCIILPDNDQAGRDHARDVAQSLRASGIRCAIVNLDGLPEKGDVSDWLKQGNGAAELEALAAEALEASEDTSDDTGAAEAETTGTPPRGFKLDARGVHYETEEDGEKAWKWLCSPIQVLALPRGSDGKGWGRLVEIVDSDGNRHRWAMPAELFAGDGNELRRECLRLGLRLSTSRSARSRFSDLLQTWTPKARATTAERLGWADEACRAFILGGGRVIGDEEVVYQAENVPGAAAEIHEAGSLEQWRDVIGAACVGNPLMTVAVSFAFAGAMLEPLKLEGGGLHLRGASSRGKTTILQSAVSVWGSPRFLQTWRATSNGLEGVATACNGTLLALDEMAEVSPREAGQVAYMIANGRGKARANRTGAARSSAQWRTAILSSGEITLADKMAEGGQRARAGQAVRLLDVPADTRAFGAFDDLHGQTTPAAFADHIKRASAEAYGVAGPRFVEALLADLEHNTGQARAAIDGFRQMARERFGLSDEGQVSRAVARFGLVAAAGELATAWGLTGWQPGEAIDAALGVFDMWLTSRGGPSSGEAREAVERVRAFLTAHGASRFEDIDDGDARTVINRAGWRQGETFFIAPDTWREIHSGTDPAQAARHLLQAGYLEPDGDGRLQKTTPRAVPKRPRTYAVNVAVMGAGYE